MTPALIGLNGTDKYAALTEFSVLHDKILSELNDLLKKYHLDKTNCSYKWKDGKLTACFHL